MKPDPIPLGETATIGDHRRYPGARLMVACALCGWSKTYNPERVARRLREMHAGGHATRLDRVARHVAWPCPGCGRVQWRTALAWPQGLDARELKRLARIVRD
ncbi:MAG: hypothetical protein ACJ798_15605 [Phenylobacterium sp.]